MTRVNFGLKVKHRTQYLLNSIIRLANYEFSNSEHFNIQFTLKSNQEIILKSKIQPLVALTAIDGQELTREQIKDCLHRLEDLGIFTDLRVKVKGNPLWHFSLRLWYSLKDKKANLARFQEEWERVKTNNKKPTLNTPKEYNNKAIQNYLEGNVLEAIKDFKQAIVLDPNFAVGQYNLGCIYEQLQDCERASQAYHQAILGGLGAAYNNLGRLLILQGKYPEAVNLLLQGLQKARFTQEKCAVWKNLGWVRLKQKRYQEAEAYLLQALNIDKKQGTIYYLLAQTWEALGKSQQAHLAYEDCLRYASYHRLEEDEWIDVAREKLSP